MTRILEKLSRASPWRGTARRTVLLLTLANIVCYMDRVCISVVAPQLKQWYGLSPSQMGTVFAVFSLSYALFQAPWGFVADRMGPKPVVTAAIFAWSAMTAITTLAWNFTSLLAIRFLFGMSEAAISPAVASVIRQEVPVQERATAFGLFLGGGRLGGAVAPFLTALIVVRFGWQTMFLLFGVLAAAVGFIWIFLRPPDRTETRPVAKQPARKLLLSNSLIALLSVSFSHTLMWQFFVTWFPTYLVEYRGFSLVEAGAFTGLPLLFGLAACWTGGLLSDALVRKFGTYPGRCALGVTVLSLSAILLYTGVHSGNKIAATILISLAAGVVDLKLATSWAWASDIGGESAGTASGLLNTASNLGAFFSPLVIGRLLQSHYGWTFILNLAALCDLVGAGIWFFVRPVVKEEALVL